MAKYSRSMQVEGKLVVDEKSFAAGIRKAVRDTDKLNRAAKQTGRNNGFKSMGKAALGAAAGIGAVTIAADQLRRSVTDTVDLAKATRQLQRATGLASEEASQLAGVLKVRGVNTDKLGRSFTTLAKNVESAKTGVGGAAEAFAKLGVSQQAIQSGNINQILIEASAGFQKLGDGTTKAAVAQQLFGRNSRDLLPLLEGGSQKLRDQLALAPQLSDAQVKQSLAVVNAQRQMQLAMLNVRTTIGTALMPVISQGADKLAKFVTEMKTGKGEGGKFAEQVRKIWESVKPAVEQLARFTRAAFEFAANHPGLVKVAAAFAAIGLAIKGMKFVSAISGLSTFLSTAKGLGGPLKKLFSRFGSRAGGAFAAEAAGNMAADMSTAVAPSGKLGKMAGEKGKFAKWGARAGKFARIAFIAAFTYLMVKELGDWMGRHLDSLLGKFGLGPNDPHGDRSGQDLSAPRTVKPGDMPGKIKRRSGPRAKGSSVGGMRAPGRRGPYAGIDMGALSDQLDIGLGVAQARSDAAQARADRFGDMLSRKSKVTKNEQRELRELQRLAAAAGKEVDKIQAKINRRDAIVEIRNQFKAWGQGFVEAFSSGLENIANARLTAAQTLAQKTLDAQLAALDEEEGQSEEARRIRELRNQQEADQKAREDASYAENKKLLEDELARAIRNGNVNRQRELNQSIEDLDTQRRDTLRAREIQDLSDSLSRQRKAAQDEFEARMQRAQDYYDDQVAKNAQAVADYKARIDQQMKDLTDSIESGKISWQDYNTKLNEIAGTLTADLKSQLDTRAQNEATQLAADKAAYGTYVKDVNKVFEGIVKDIPAPVIPQPPDIHVKVIYDVQNLPSGVSAPTQPSAPSTPEGPVSVADMRRDLSRPAYKNAKVKLSQLASAYRRSKEDVKKLLRGQLKDIVKKQKLDVDYNRASGGLLRSGLTMVGETGPEMILNGQVYSASRTKRMSGAGVTLNVYPQTTADDPVALARALGWQLATR